MKSSYQQLTIYMEREPSLKHPSKGFELDSRLSSYFKQFDCFNICVFITLKLLIFKLDMQIDCEFMQMLK